MLNGTQVAYASHAQGGQLTYEPVYGGQPNRYRITCRLSRDCAGISAPVALTLSCRAGGTYSASCGSNDPRNFTATLVRGPIATGTPYCASIGNACSPTSRPNYETATYEAVVTLPPAPAWTLSVVENARPALANIASNTNLYLQATLHNQVTLPNGQVQTLTNSSPLFSEQQEPIAFVCYQQRTTLHFAATEHDGDSLVYSLETPLDGCQAPAGYRPLSAGNGSPVISLEPGSTTQNPCLIYPASNSPQQFSRLFPLPSFQVTGSCPAKTFTPFFQFSPRLGTFSFIPTYFDATSFNNNQYAVTGKVTEYRRLNGRYYEVGSVRRDMLVTVIDCGTNQAPNPPSTTAGQPGPPIDSLVLEAPVQVNTTLDYHFTDPNAGDLLRLTPWLPADVDMYYGLCAGQNFQGEPLTVVGNNTPSPRLEVRLRPVPALLGRTIRIPIWVEDNGCPVKVKQHYLLVLRIVAPRPTATQSGQPPVVVSAFPNPFTEQVRFTLPRPAAAAVPVLDALGRVVAELPVPAGSSPEVQLTWTPVAAQPAGVYLVRVPGTGHTLRLLRR